MARLLEISKWTLKHTVIFNIPLKANAIRLIDPENIIKTCSIWYMNCLGSNITSVPSGQIT